MLYRVRFHSADKQYELYAKSVYQGEMFGFLVVEDLVFGEQSEVIVNPQEEQLKIEFANTTRLFVPLHNVVLLEQVRKRGKAKIYKQDFRKEGLEPTVYTKTPKGNQE